MESKTLVKLTNSIVACRFFHPYVFKDSTDGQYGSISSEAIFVFPKNVVNFGFYAVS